MTTRYPGYHGIFSTRRDGIEWVGLLVSDVIRGIRRTQKGAFYDVSSVSLYESAINVKPRTNS